MTEGDVDETVCCEAYGPAGAALIVACRPEAAAGAAARARAVVIRHGAQVGAPGSLSYLFRVTGKLTLGMQAGLAEAAAAAGAEDVLPAVGGCCEVLTDPAETAIVRERLAQAGFPAASAGVTRSAAHRVRLSPEQAKQLDLLCNELRAIDGITGVYSNGQIP